MPNINLTSYQEGMCSAGTKLFSALTCSIITLIYDIQVFMPTLRDCLLAHSFL